MKLSISLRGQALVGYFGQRRFYGGDERPVLFVLGPLLYPLLEKCFLLRLECAVGIGRRHHVRFVIARHAPPELALLGVAGDDGRDVVVLDEGGVGGVESQVGLAGLFIEAVALEAVFTEDGADVAVEVERLSGRIFSGWREP